MEISDLKLADHTGAAEQTGAAKPEFRIQDPDFHAQGADRQLMQRVTANCDAAIRQACRASTIPPAFLAALVANESGGDRFARRFEPKISAGLLAVLDGERMDFWGITRGQIDQALDEALNTSRDAAEALFASSAAMASTERELARDLATSWGLTQIMGYHELPHPPYRLLSADYNLQRALELLAEFAERFALDPARDFAELFHCWNTGQPYGPPRGPATFDPLYVKNGLSRIRAYAELTNAKKA